MHTLSLIIPCYNKIKYLEQCIESVMQQTRLPDEIILVDDCSSDGTRELIKKLEKTNSRIKPLLLEKNGGVSVARNAGILAATGDVISFLDSDDIIWGSKKIEKEMELLEKSPKNSLVYSLTVVIDEDRNKVNQQKLKKSSLVLGFGAKPYLLSGRCINQYIPRDYCISRELLTKVGMFDETMNYFEDLDLLIRLSDYCEFVCSNVCGTGYRQVDGGLSDKSAVKHKETIRSLRKRYIPQLNIWDKIRYYWLRFVFLANRAFNKIKK